MKQTAFLLKSLVLTTMMGWSLTGNAQRYDVDRGRVYFGQEIVMYADSHSFVDLGSGYAKDRNNVYMNGHVLENVDPSTFRLKERSTWRRHGNGESDMQPDRPNRGYFKTQFNVYYGDKKIDAIASSFVDLGGGYAKDAFNVFYFGEKIKGAMASNFTVLEGGYSKDSFNVYYFGEKVQGAMASNFTVLEGGYSKDSFNVYYFGEKVQGAWASSFRYTGNGYGQDDYNAFYRGRKLK